MCGERSAPSHADCSIRMGMLQREEEPGSDEPCRECVRAEREGVPREPEGHERGRRGGRGRVEGDDEVRDGENARWVHFRFVRFGSIE